MVDTFCGRNICIVCYSGGDCNVRFERDPMKRNLLSRKMTNVNQTSVHVRWPRWYDWLIPRPRVVIAIALWAYVIREVVGMVTR